MKEMDCVEVLVEKERYALSLIHIYMCIRDR